MPGLPGAATPFELLLFTTSVPVVSAAAAAGIDAIVVDWEARGKDVRQVGADTQINHDTLEDLERVRAVTAGTVICRINGPDVTTREEIEAAILAGADELLVPMVRHVDQVRRIHDLVAGRCGVGILVETNEAVSRASELGRLPLSRVFVGMNDLAIERGTPSIFTSLTDGTIDQVRQPFVVPFGFGGLTLPHRGFPVPCHLLIGEMVRLRCSFSFLRRSFLRDVPLDRFDGAVADIRAALIDAEGRRMGQVASDCQALASVLSVGL